MDSADVNSRLESLQLAEPEADDIYLGLAQAYVHLTELTVADKNAARTALNKAKNYLKRDGAVQSTGASQNLLASIQLFDKRLNSPETQSPDPAKLFAQANAAFEKGMILEASSNLDNALKQYSLAKTLCERIKDLGVSNPAAEALRGKASEAIVRALLKIKPQ